MKVAAFSALTVALLTPLAPAAGAASPIDSLDQAALQETFRLLRKNYIQRESITPEALNRAALEGLLERLDFGAELVPLKGADETAPPASVLVSELLDGGIAYVRPGAFAEAELPAFDAALKKAAEAKASTLVLDLRAPAAHGEFSAAAAFLSRFLPPDQPLFSVQKLDEGTARQFRSKGQPLWTGPLVLLMDADCPNVAETIAAVLVKTLDPVTLGSPTRGRTMEYATATISPTHALRFASAEMRLSDGASLFRKGLVPRIAAPFDPAEKAKVFAAQPAEGVKKFVTNDPRPRNNEHALVTRTAPELPYQVAKAAGNPTPWDTAPLQDRPLRQALDLLTAQAFLKE